MQLSDLQKTEASGLLWRNWMATTRIGSLPEACRPQDRAAGYAIAETLAAKSGQSVAGWKIAATSEAGQKHINVDGPLAGRILSERLLKAGAKVPLGDNIMRVAEAEFAFRFGRDLPARSAAYDMPEVLEAVSALHLSMEIPDSRYSDFTKVGAAQLIADTACACWLVLGDAVTADWRGIDLSAHKVDAYVDGVLKATGTGKAVLGDPRKALTWLVNEASAYCGGITAGQFVTTGTCIVPVAVSPGSSVRFDYGVLGTLEAQIV
jgi:2-keto-4-pentenoate hydratase